MIDILFNNLNPFLNSSPLLPVYYRAQEGGFSNIKFDRLFVVAENLPSVPPHAISFLRIVNRYRHGLLPTDFSFLVHSNPNNISEDGTGTKNQDGTASETYLNPPSSLSVLPWQIEWYKQDTLNRLGMMKQQSSPILTPEVDWSSIRNIRIIFEKIRTGYSNNSTGSALKLGSLWSGDIYGVFVSSLPEYFRWLFMSPDRDYPEGNELLVNNLLESTQNSGSTVLVSVLPTTYGYLQWPVGLSILTLFSDGLTINNTPQIINISGGMKTLKIFTATTNNNQQILPISDNRYPLTDKLGLWNIFEGTSEAERNNTPRLEYNYNLNWGSTSVVNNGSNIINFNLLADDDYFSDIVYGRSSEEDYLQWESDQGSGQTVWYSLNSGGTLSTSYVGSNLRHKLNSNILPGKYSWRLAVNAFSSAKNYSVWGNWSYPNDKLLIDYDDNTQEISSSQVVPASPGDGVNPLRFRLEMGYKGLRGLAYKVKYEKSNISGTCNAYLNYDINRLVYLGDLLKYEVLIDTTSVENNIYLDVEYYNVGSSGTTSLLSSTAQIGQASSFSLKNKWYKVTIDLNGLAGKYIKRLIFRTNPSSSLGNVLCYVNEVQIMNIMAYFNGRQVTLHSNLKRTLLKDNILTHPDSDDRYSYYQTGLIGYISDSNGVIIDHRKDITYHNQSFSDSINNTDGDYIWTVGLHGLEYSRYLKKVAVFFGLNKTYSYDGINWRGPRSDQGGYVEVERVYVSSMNALDFVLAYSTDNSPNNTSGPPNDFISYSSLGYKAWGLQVQGRKDEV